jgi:DNA-binding IclR family transcriptional regulator
MAALFSKRAAEYAKPAFEKGLDVLELLSKHPEGLTKSQIARQLSRTVSEIFRMPVCLERRNHIVQTSEERCAIALRYFNLCRSIHPLNASSSMRCR